jgi:ribosomal protein S27AE
VEDLAQQLRIDVDRRTTRGRSCPRCGGKIIPSHRAVYQSAGDPNDVYPSWQCERCGYEELISRPVKAAAKHGAASAEKATPAKVPSAVSTSSAGSVSTASRPGVVARAVPALKDRKGRALPPDVNRMMDEMSRDRETKE